MKLQETTGDLCSAVWVCMSEEAEELFILPPYIFSLHCMKYLCDAAGRSAGGKWSMCAIAWLVATLQRIKKTLGEWDRVAITLLNATFHGYFGRSWRHKGHRFIHSSIPENSEGVAELGSVNFRLNAQCFWLVTVNKRLNMIMFPGYYSREYYKKV